MQITDLDATFPRRGRPDIAAIVGLNLEVYSGEFIGIVGPSGCGKTTLLNVIAGLLSVQLGLRIDGTPVSGPGRDRAVVFQQPSLPPWRTVTQNFMYGLELQRIPDWANGCPLGHSGHPGPRRDPGRSCSSCERRLRNHRCSTCAGDSTARS